LKLLPKATATSGTKATHVSKLAAIAQPIVVERRILTTEEAALLRIGVAADKARALIHCSTLTKLCADETAAGANSLGLGIRTTTSLNSGTAGIRAAPSTDAPASTDAPPGTDVSTRAGVRRIKLGQRDAAEEHP
jgi:hypothetical protein